MFRNRFLKTVGCREDLDPIDNFQYLIQHLGGEPLRTANRYFLTDANYYKFLDRLEDRCGDTATLATLLARDFDKIRPVGQSSKDLHRLNDEARSLTDQIEMLGQDINSNHHWRHTLLSKMRLSLWIKIAENLGKDPMTTPIQEILTCIFEYARLLEKSEAFNPWNAAEGNSRHGDLPCRTYPRSTHYRAGSDVIDLFIDDDTSELSDQSCRSDSRFAADHPATDVPRAAAAVATINADEQLQERQTCPLCGDLHSAADCTVYDTTKKRLRRAQKLKMCIL
ncbi:hypothetical protein AAVH_34458 [Aphelenchoides avenae]|nr:hypothetical protein AAVH_34458 [Aphelenchus avenae]